jgi:DNA/RNA endonuclease G (NUC1)
MEKFREIFVSYITENTVEFILEGYSIKDFAGILDKMKVPYKMIKKTIQVPSNYWKDIDKAIKKTKNQFKQQDAMDTITIRLA